MKPAFSKPTKHLHSPGYCASLTHSCGEAGAPRRRQQREPTDAAPPRPTASRVPASPDLSAAADNFRDAGPRKARGHKGWFCRNARGFFTGGRREPGGWKDEGHVTGPVRRAHTHRARVCQRRGVSAGGTTGAAARDARIRETGRDHLPEPEAGALGSAAEGGAASPAARLEVRRETRRMVGSHSISSEVPFFSSFLFFPKQYQESHDGNHECVQPVTDRQPKLVFPQCWDAFP